MTTPRKPDNHLVEALLSTAFCCFPLGLVALIFAVKTERYWARGDAEAALEASHNARTWSVIAVLGGLVAGIFLAMVSILLPFGLLIYDYFWGLDWSLL